MEYRREQAERAEQAYNQAKIAVNEAEAQAEFEEYLEEQEILAHVREQRLRREMASPTGIQAYSSLQP